MVAEIIVNQVSSPQPSLRQRYLTKLAKGMTDAALNVLLLLFVPRTLGPANYGSFSFVRDSFQNSIALADLNLGSAHVNYASRQHDSQAGTSLYFTYVLAVGVVLVIGLAGLMATGLISYILPGQSSLVIWLGACLAYAMYAHVGVMGLADSKAETVGFELRAIGVNSVMFVGLAALYATGSLTLPSYFAARIVLFVALVFVGALYLNRTIGFVPRLTNPLSADTRKVARAFASYSHPLVALSVFGLLIGWLDRWLLQVIYGSVSQGYFSLAFTVTSISGLFLSPMTPLLMQSVARADEDEHTAGVRTAFSYVEPLYFTSALIALFFAFHVSDLTRLIGGEQFRGAEPTLVVMFLYPLHVVYGQFCGGTLLALRETRRYRDIALTVAVAGVPISYFLLAPRDFLVPGLGLGSTGLALKLVLVQLLSVTLQLHFICRRVGEPMSRFLRSQLLTPIPLVAVGVLDQAVRETFELHPATVLATLLTIAVSFVAWAAVVGLALWRFPSLAGLDRERLQQLVHETKTMIAAGYERMLFAQRR